MNKSVRYNQVFVKTEFHCVIIVMDVAMEPILLDSQASFEDTWGVTHLWPTWKKGVKGFVTTIYSASEHDLLNRCSDKKHQL